MVTAGHNSSLKGQAGINGGEREQREEIWEKNEEGYKIGMKRCIHKRLSLYPNYSHQFYVGGKENRMLEL